MPLPPDGQVAEFDREIAENVVRAAAMASNIAAIGPAPLSRIRNPDGSSQNETLAERDSRMVRIGVMHLLEQGLVVFPADIAETLDGWIPVERVGTD